MKPIFAAVFLGGFVVSAVFWALIWPLGAEAGEAKVVNATATANGGGSYTFSATIAHADTGWKHYADKFEVLAPDGRVLGTRVLYHPHVNEQPFTRSLGGVQVPAGLTEVIVRASDNVHKAGKATFTVKLPGR
jgi:hypothetical protein